MPMTTRFRQWYVAQPRAIRTLLAINVVVYLLWQLLLIHFDGSRTFVWSNLALNPTIPGIFYKPWELLTYSFLHLQPGFGGLLHILFNMLWMVWIGREYEQMHGPERIVALYVFGGLGGAIATVLLHALLPAVGSFGGIVHGASGSVLGIMMAIAIQYRQKSIALMFIGVVKLLHVVVGFLVLDILFIAGGGTSVSAHLGGVLAGYFSGRAFLSGVNISWWARPFFVFRPNNTGGFFERLESTLGQRSDVSSRTRKGGRGAGNMRILSEEEKKKGTSRSQVRDSASISSQMRIDDILDKISAGGYESLTKAEKQYLFEASKGDEE